MYELEFRDTNKDASPIATTTTSATATASPTCAPFTVARIAEAVNLAARLADREKLPPAELDAALAARSQAHSLTSGGTPNAAAADTTTTGPSRGVGGDNNANTYAFIPRYPLDRLFPGTYYLDGVGTDRTRSYRRRAKDAVRVQGGALAPCPAEALLEKEGVLSRDTGGNPLGGGEGGEEGEAGGNGTVTASVTEASVSIGKGEEQDEVVVGEHDVSVGVGDVDGLTVLTSKVIF